MNRMLRGFLLALVLANLLFVQITRAAGLRWLVPLYALAFSSPLLVRFQESWLYRALWNATVICVFAVLVQDATLTGILHLLEDGLVLAALCQVHLLNNLGRGQKPDLLFFNSFLITLVTCFFSQDLGFSLLFLAYAPLLLISMQLACLTRRGEEPSFTTLRLVAGDGLRRSVILIGVTAVVFLCFPRDFRREGFVGARLDLFSLPARNELGFSEEVRLGRTGQTTASNRVVLKARLLRGLPEQVPSYWRGATFTRLMGNGWQADRFVQSVSRFETDDWWWLNGFGTWVRKGHAPGARLLIEILDPGAARLFNPLESQRLAVLPPTDPMLTQIMLDGTVRYIRGTESSGAEPLKYEVELFERKKTGSSSPTKPQNSRAYLSLHPGSLPPEARLLALRIARSPADASQGERVESLRRYLATNYQYLLPGAPGATRGLAEFIRGEGGGHCEYFATALAVMLRSLRIPCRLVTGYRSDEWDVKSQELIVRRKHAHAWVEVHDPARGWYTVDASPAGPEGSATSSPSWWKLTETVARQWWTKVLGFDGEARARAMAWLGSLPGRSLEFLRQRLGWTLVFAALAALSVWLRILWRRRRVPAAVRSYLDTVKQLRLERGPGETPRELLERSRELSEQQRELLAAATDEHERERYLA